MIMRTALSPTKNEKHQKMVAVRRHKFLTDLWRCDVTDGVEHFRELWRPLTFQIRSDRRWQRDDRWNQTGSRPECFSADSPTLKNDRKTTDAKIQFSERFLFFREGLRECHSLENWCIIKDDVFSSECQWGPFRACAKWRSILWLIWVNFRY